MVERMRSDRAVKAVIEIGLVAIAYWVVARLSLNLALVHGQVTPIWPPTGIALVAILCCGKRVWPGVYVAALAVNLPIGPSPLGAAVIAAGNTLAPLVAATLLKRAGFHLELDRLRDAAAIIGLGALVSMTVSATIGTSVLVSAGAVANSSFWSTWAVWWVGDAMGVLLVAPFLLSVLPTFPPQPLTLRTGLALTALLAGIGVVTFALFQTGLRLEYLVFPLIMVAAWRFGLRGAAPAALIASGIAIWSAVQGMGPFATETLVQKMVTLQVFNVCVALASFVLASFVATRDKEEETRRMYVSASAANEAKSQFLNVAAHELRTPITVLNGYLSMLSEGSLGPAPLAWERPIDILVSKTKELEKIVDDLLEASRLEVEPGPATRTTLDLRRIVNEAVERANSRAELIGAEIRTDLPSQPTLVEADPAQLARLLDNLINNGLTFTLKSPRLRIRLSSDANRAVIRVEDNGVGIPENQREKVFERFARNPDPMMAKVPGVGLGLYISRKLANGQAGQLVVERSDPDAGTVFALALPVTKPSGKSN